VKELITIKNLKVSTKQTIVLHDINLTIKQGEIHAIMGPNGSGKSSLALTLMGHPAYQITNGSITFDGEIINDLSPDKRAQKGIFLGMQYPTEIEGVTYRSFLRQAYNALYSKTDKKLNVAEFHNFLLEKSKLLNISEQFLTRSINVGFSGGEKKKAELLQLAVLQPKLAILDEIDSGLDIDALKTVCDALKKIKEDNPEMAIILITHYKRMLDHITPDFVHVLQKGSIVQTGGLEVADKLEKQGYQEK